MLLVLAAQRRLLPSGAGRAPTATWDIYEAAARVSSTGCARGRSGSSGWAGSATCGAEAPRLPPRRSSPTTRSSTAPATPRSSWSRSTSWRPGRHRRLVRGPDRHVARDHRRRDFRPRPSRRRSSSTCRAAGSSRRTRWWTRWIAATSAYAALDVRSAGAAGPVSGPDHRPRRRRPDPAHRRELGRIDRRPPRRGGRADHQAAARGRPAPAA